ncbi:hypothetical protein EV426DRAFT_190143 [Tirmania nivea]|nr:hypothetical protein EV426DRAFT_190143 [Tirmania nivea]
MLFMSGLEFPLHGGTENLFAFTYIYLCSFFGSFLSDILFDIAMHCICTALPILALPALYFHCLKLLRDGGVFLEYGVFFVYDGIFIFSFTHYHMNFTLSSLWMLWVGELRIGLANYWGGLRIMGWWIMRGGNWLGRRSGIRDGKVK